MPDQFKYQDNDGNWITVPLSREEEISIAFKIQRKHHYPFTVKYEDGEYLFCVGASGARLNQHEPIQQDTWYSVVDGDEITLGDPQQAKPKTRILFSIQTPPAELFLDRYLLLETLCEREGQIVYKARDTKLGKLVVIHKISPKTLSIEQTRRFIRMCSRNYPKLAHANIAQLLDYGVREDCLYICREYVAGKTLEEMIRNQGPLEVREALEIFLKIADALAYVHQKQIVYRSLTPAHIIIGPHGMVKLIGLSLVKSRKQSQDPARSGIWVGEVGFAAPEQIGVTNGEVDRRSDIYSLGAVLYWMLCGVSLVGSKSIADYVRQMAGKIPPPTPASLGVPLCVSRVVMKALRYQPQERYQEIAAMRQPLQEYLYSGKYYFSSQSMSLPSTLQDIAGIQVQVVHEPYAAVGGDFVWAAPISEGLGLFLGEVHRDSPDAFYLEPMVQALLGVLCEYLDSPTTILQQLNRQIYERTAGEACVQGTLLLVDNQTAKLRLAHAKHPPLLCYNPKRTPHLQCWQAPGMVLGMVPANAFQCKELQVELQGGDLLLLHSTGVLQGFRGPEALRQRVTAVLERTATASLTQWASSIKEVISEGQAGHEPQEDHTMVLMRYDRGYQFSLGQGIFDHKT